MSADPSQRAAGRALRLFGLELLSWGHRLRHDLARELSALMASLVLMAAFGYVFHDFLNVEIAALSPGMRLFLARMAAVFLFVAVTIAAARSVARARAFGPGLAASARQLGELDVVIARYGRLRDATIILAMHAAALVFSDFILVPWPWPLSFGLCALGAAISTMWGPRMAQRASQLSPQLKGASSTMPWTTAGQSPARAAAAWRMAQLSRRPWTAGLILKLSLASAVGAGLASAMRWPDLVPVALGFLAGSLVAATLAAQLAEDLRSAWAERSLGLSHDNIVAAYLQLAIRLGGRSALAYLASVALFGAICFFVPGKAFALAPLVAFAAKVCVIILMTPLATPYLMFQIDGRRVAVNIVVITVVGLFMATGLYAHWAAVLIPLILFGAAAGNQQGRYHRA